VTVTQNGTTVSQQEIIFSVRFRSQRTVALRDLQSGTVIQSEDVKIEQVESSDSDPADWKEPFGLVVKRRISKALRFIPIGSVRRGAGGDQTKSAGGGPTEYRFDVSFRDGTGS